MELKDIRVSFVGFGNMAEAMAKGLIKKGLSPKNITVCARDWGKLKKKAEPLGIIPCRDVYEAVYYSDIGIIAVKPNQVEEALSDYLDLFQEKPFVSVVYGWSFDDYEKFIGTGSQHISIIPNTPVQIGQGVILREEKHSFDGGNVLRANILFETLGMVEILPNKLMSIGSALSGCGPALVYEFMEALADVGVYHGLTRRCAYRLAGATVSGAGATMLETGEHPGNLKDAVCSPGGTTIKGVCSLHKEGFSGNVIKAIDEIVSE